MYQLLYFSYEGQFQLAAYDFEQDKDNYAKLLETEKTSYFSKHVASKIIINNEFWRTNSYSQLYF